MCAYRVAYHSQEFGEVIYPNEILKDVMEENSSIKDILSLCPEIRASWHSSDIVVVVLQAISIVITISFQITVNKSYNC